MILSTEKSTAQIFFYICKNIFDHNFQDIFKKKKSFYLHKISLSISVNSAYVSIRRPRYSLFNVNI